MDSNALDNINGYLNRINEKEMKLFWST
ncbi:hypothetical protein PHYNN_202 [Pantoea phage Phynn]|nr:hypothetical protein PHYNN_202 [Pantoea phage Phynn]